MRKEPQAPPRPSSRSPSTRSPSPRPCPICGKPPVAGYAPFCSKRCADVDLHKWLGGHYAIPAEEPADPEELPSEDLPPQDGER